MWCSRSTGQHPQGPPDRPSPRAALPKLREKKPCQCVCRLTARDSPSPLAIDRQPGEAVKLPGTMVDGMPLPAAVAVAAPDRLRAPRPSRPYAGSPSLSACPKSCCNTTPLPSRAMLIRPTLSLSPTMSRAAARATLMTNFHRTRGLLASHHIRHSLTHTPCTTPERRTQP
ncbi:uncharacterized protein K452DRAFT_138255 [Aplosporella prunicola CBS 121167]|uniref:Uncharacterized protein n=1 Tax=Aplosporella prunicola CBS 121167 TaxID=1176127 RepID=A0A6A6AWF6_9PEZI|nr:uncharacterized protein K452DRAFT_139074 [Aplosporella prunicola CBS 121167]XP_033392067.1 uncharacterized protein K452DRAFT_138255 [Aplosporella prunicola CBS 121167]KAF2136269.1 hypothetical protein K452DRAFT_139074 [Aplosporella prunicola CBS 121167]KAF2136349.1 hypothetical protein K452DRAFT_138255 [Aplosporella prunicola CBS 121167]